MHGLGLGLESGLGLGLGLGLHVVLTDRFFGESLAKLLHRPHDEIILGTKRIGSYLTPVLMSSVLYIMNIYFL